MYLVIIQCLRRITWWWGGQDIGLAIKRSSISSSFILLIKHTQWTVWYKRYDTEQADKGTDNWADYSYMRISYFCSMFLSDSLSLDLLVASPVMYSSCLHCVSDCDDFVPSYRCAFEAAITWMLFRLQASISASSICRQTHRLRVSAAALCLVMRHELQRHLMLFSIAVSWQLGLTCKCPFCRHRLLAVWDIGYCNEVYITIKFMWYCANMCHYLFSVLG